MQNSIITDIKVDGGCDLNRTIVHSFGSLLVFVFYSSTNENSKELIANLESSIPIFGEYENVKYYSLSQQMCPQTLKKFQVTTLPTVVLTQMDRKIIDKYQGNDISEIFQRVERISKQHKAQFQRDKIVWHPKVKSVLESCPFLVFIKGTPENPKCGFTRSLLQILNKYQIQFTYYDINVDGQMGNWTRHYSKWLTFPQVYINGKLIGGLDVTKELIEKGQFEKMIPESCKKNSPDQRFAKFIQQHQTIIFVDGFAFENKKSQIAIEQARKKYGDGVTIYNVALDMPTKNFILEKISKNIPFIVQNKEVVKID